MIQNNRNEQLTRIGNWISLRLDKYESIIALIFVIGCILKISTDLEISILIVFALMTLSILYFLNAFSVLDDKNVSGLEKFINKLVSLSGSIAAIGILFKLEHWPGYNTMLTCSCITLILLLPIILTIKTKKPDLRIFNQRLVIRVVLIATLGLIINFVSRDTLIKVGLDKKISTEKIE